ncbi:PAS domain-containing sensor histidine kinase [uncultured Tateyamaria sp.]|uniref:sensor histidine kinase n=1 Tax=uncultured Tateyamaria sp. TaxID=455651 RepID=UPI00260BB638|nr:PAS domain-containing sensor histidine kinase [uncultured Tateyamaria sp.]
MQRLDYSIYDLVDAPVFVLVADERDRPVYDFLNKVGRDRLGKDLSDIVGKAAHEIFTGRAAYSVFRQQFKVWQSGRSSAYEIALPLNDDKVWFRTSLVAAHDASGRLLRMVGTSHDISAERALSLQDAMTAAAASEVEEMVCLAAHDLRSPIGNMKSLAYLMRRDFVDHGDGKLELIDMIDSLADKSLAVISETMAQVMAKSAPSIMAEFDLGTLCDDVLVLLDPVRTHSVSYPRAVLNADVTALHIILRNLIDNAFKHAGTKTVRVKVSLSQVNAQRLRICVTDDGKGFGADGGAGPAPNPSRRGFGLSAVRRLVRARGGTVEIGSNPDRAGASVQIDLPGRIVAMEQDTARAG